MCNKYPGICKDDGTFETNVCAFEKEYCNAPYTPDQMGCAADWSTCAFNKDFNFCKSFPKLCGSGFEYGAPFFSVSDRSI